MTSPGPASCGKISHEGTPSLGTGFHQCAGYVGALGRERHAERKSAASKRQTAVREICPPGPPLECIRQRRSPYLDSNCTFMSIFMLMGCFCAPRFMVISLCE